MHGEDNRRWPPDGWHVLGLMSGTSVDGLDVASVQFTQKTQDGSWSFDLNAATTLEYPLPLQRQLWDAMSLDAVELRRLDKDWAQWAGQAVSTWVQQMNLPAIHLVGSHGHTVFHRPDEGWTWQLGSGAVLHAALGVPVVCDFRSLDVASGGQGAPLVPLADRELFGGWDVALNLGDSPISVSKIPALGRVAWDVGPANLLMNLIAQTIGLSMDEDGTRAASGTVLPSLLKRWQDAPFHRLRPPKSLGREWLEQEVWPHAQQALESHAVEDVLATAVAYILGRGPRHSRRSVRARHRWRCVQPHVDAGPRSGIGGTRHPLARAPFRPRQRQGSTGVRVAGPSSLVGPAQRLAQCHGCESGDVRRRALGCWAVERRVLSEWEVTRCGLG